MTGNVLILTTWGFNDALIRAYTLPYLDLMRSALSKEFTITLVTSEQGPSAITEEEYKEVSRIWKSKNMHLIALPFKRFGFKKMLSSLTEMRMLISYIRKNNVKIIHAFCTPAGAMGYLLSKLSGAKLVIDSYEPHADAMVENGTWKAGGLAHSILSRLEKLQSKRASILIGTTRAMQQLAKDKFKATENSFYVKPACVDVKTFFPRQKDEAIIARFKLEGKIVCIYAGKLGGIYLNHEIFAFIKRCYNFWGDTFRFLMLTNASIESVEKGRLEYDIPQPIIIRTFVKHDEVPSYLSVADFAINPVKPVPTKRYCTSLKDGEYWAMGLPVVITKDISDDSDIIESRNIGFVLKELNERSYDEAIFYMDNLLKGDQQQLKQKIHSIAREYRDYSLAESIYSKIYGNDHYSK